jgi:predicted metal-dependent peptidase
MFDSDLSAEKKLSKARVQLVLHDPFFGSMSMRAIVCEDEWGILPYQTIATDGKYIIYNRKYIDSLELAESKTELTHEVAHIILKHQLRRGDREFELWNIACDQAVDHILVDAGYKLAKKWKDRLEDRFKNKAAEEIYMIMKNERKTAQKSKQSKQSKGGAGGAGASGAAPAPGTAPVKTAPKSPTPTQKGEYKIDTTNKAQPLPNVDLSKIHGLILDAPINLKDKQAVRMQEEYIDIAIEQAAKLCGNLPGSLRTLVKADRKHQVNYKDLLRDFLETSLSPGDYDWMRPDRSYTTMNIYIPGLTEEEDKINIVFACDSSGSIGPAEKKVFADEICGVLEDFPCDIEVIYCDTMVHEPTQHITAEDFPIELEFKGGGGTSFAPVFEYIKKEKTDFKAVLYFTDLCVSNFGEDPGVPVLWMNTFRTNDKKQVPFGKIIPLELSKIQQAQLNFS